MGYSLLFLGFQFSVFFHHLSQNFHDLDRVQRIEMILLKLLVDIPKKKRNQLLEEVFTIHVLTKLSCTQFLHCVIYPFPFLPSGCKIQRIRMWSKLYQTY